uniref:Uncharacterized protein n=1 Tax=Chromera velia CCMP2878 TaxID=1169474 RepID=A0A0K6SA17_9ALVE|eukprot:Cvel_8570.t2-p1 / transcript=Cvel_8570.t2 / gene=Cvel_8570 / organism=Chromera_velia_CCMP2878 / gene_product=Probable E3 ubiquitin-protein ligase HERC1, putative / transcript_product=Probable E3 ubiquitin-protein ligase HERC1, putative / location=Cvel_scaffold475:66860-70054(-) / protein_length=477 / sequence_SO=supercontig / SO=protein_coding / is_pseudo=false
MPVIVPALAGRWCNIPTRLKTQFGWQDNTKTWEDPIPLRSEEGIVVRPNGVIKGENAPTNLPTQAKKEKPYFPSRRVEVGDAVNFFCTGGLLYPPGGSVCKRRKRQKANETENFKQSETAGQTSELRDRGEIAAGETNGEEEEETLEPDFVPSLEDIECRQSVIGCRVPDKWRRGSEQQKFIPSDSFPVTVVEYNDAYSDVWEKYTNGTPIKEGTRVLFSCPTGALTIASATCRTRKSPETKQRFIAFDPPESYVDCKGCPVPSQWVDPPQKAPLLPVTLEVQRGGKGEWLERADNSAIGAGDLVRFRCATGKLVSDAVTESPSGASADEGEGAGVNGTATSRVRVVECQRNGTSEPTLHFNSTAHVPCSGCRVPYEWLGKGGGSRIVTASRVFRSRSPAEEQAGSAGEEFKEAETSIGVNDTISFECVRGGVLHLQSSLSQSGSAGLRGATCVNPGGEELGESEFGLNISDVKCGR